MMMSNTIIPVLPAAADLSNPFATQLGIPLSDSELRETAYQVLVRSCRSIDGKPLTTYIPQSQRMSPAPERSLLMIVDIDDGSNVKKALGLMKSSSLSRKGQDAAASSGLPLLGIKWQEMQNPYLRAFMKMEHDQHGILITEVMPNYPESVVLKPYDVILSIDGINIGNYGTVQTLRGDWIEFSYLISKKYKGDKVVIKVRRGSAICEFITELATHKQFVPANIIGRPVRYYIIGGLVFTTVSLPYIQFKHRGKVGTPDEDELDTLFSQSQALYEEHVVLCEVLNDAIIDGACTMYLVENKVLVTFNNKPVEGLKSLVSMVETCNEDFMKFTFENHKILVLPTNIARSRTPDILKVYSISCAMSDDLKELVKLT